MSSLIPSEAQTKHSCGYSKIPECFDSGVIYDRTKGTQYQGQAFPEFMQKIIKAEGLINYINER